MATLRKRLAHALRDGGPLDRPHARLAHVKRRVHAAARAHHAKRHPVTAPANVRHHESLSLSDHAALLCTQAVGTMACAVLFALLALVSLPAALATHDALVIVAWVAQTFLQLVLLPVIMVGQNLASRHSETRAEAEFETTQESLAHLIQQDAWLLELVRAQQRQAGPK